MRLKLRTRRDDSKRARSRALARMLGFHGRNDEWCIIGWNRCPSLTEKRQGAPGLAA